MSLRDLKPAALVAFIPMLSQIIFAFTFGFMLGRIFNLTFLRDKSYARSRNRICDADNR